MAPGREWLLATACLVYIAIKESENAELLRHQTACVCVFHVPPSSREFQVAFHQIPVIFLVSGDGRQ